MSLRYRFIRVAVVVVAVAALVYLWLADPATSPAPQCIFRLATGYDCPGCGTQRAVHALLHGEFAQAWACNAALFPALIVAVLYAWSPRRLRPLLFHTATPWVLAGLIVAWWIGRNL